MKSMFSCWTCRSYSFWKLACYACGSCAGWHIPYCSWRSNSIVAIAACRQCQAKQFLKKIHQSRIDNKNDIKLEYETLRFLKGGNRSTNAYLLPHAYYYSAMASAFSMEYIQGVSLARRMQHAKGAKDIEECLHISAAWLQGLHNAPIEYHCTPGIDLTTIQQRLETNCGTLINSNKTAARALMLMRSNFSRFRQLPVKHVPLHGDFKASNLMCTPHGKVYGIDFILNFKNSGAMDIAQFFIDILLNRYCLKLVEDNGNLAYILEVFLMVYGDNSQQNKTLTACWLLYFLLSRWKADLNSWKPAILVNRNYSKMILSIMALFDTEQYNQI